MAILTDPHEEAARRGAGDHVAVQHEAGAAEHPDFTEAAGTGKLSAQENHQGVTITYHQRSPSSSSTASTQAPPASLRHGALPHRRAPGAHDGRRVRFRRLWH